MSHDSHFPLDEHNRQLLGHVHPADWINPEPKPRYHLVVIGAGTAGLVSAAGAAGLGAKVALVERRLMGGDCLNFGCVPSKAILRTARAVADIRRARELGVEVSGEVRVDLPRLMERMRRVRAEISPTDSAQRFRDLGVDVFLGDARFTSGNQLEVAGKRLNFRRAILATGTRPAIPPIPGLADADCLTNESVFSLTSLPARLAIIGGGAIGCELAQAFARFGSSVMLIESLDRILFREERSAAEIIQKSLENDGVTILPLVRILNVHRQDERRVLTLQRQSEAPQTLEVDAILVAAGRKPNVENLGLDAAGVEALPDGSVRVNDRLQTTNGRIFAAGDVCTNERFTHAADALARVAVQNALFYGRAKASRLLIPRCLYTDPEVASIGMNESETHEAGIAIDTFVQEFKHVDRAVLDGDTEGFVKILVNKGTDSIVGATIVSGHAGDMIGEVALAMTGKLGLKTLASTIHPYPTHAEALKKIGDAYNRTRLTPTVRWLFNKWFAWT
jgi:pyruvate/2-oxoglutarate dehydrogenase complex dihydrolipoamide dehydrogenase (E3) component